MKVFLCWLPSVSSSQNITSYILLIYLRMKNVLPRTDFLGNLVKIVPSNNVTSSSTSDLFLSDIHYHNFVLLLLYILDFIKHILPQKRHLWWIDVLNWGFLTVVSLFGMIMLQMYSLNEQDAYMTMIGN